MKSYLKQLNSTNWETILNNETGILTHESFNQVLLKIGSGDEITMPREGINFQEKTIVEAKNYNTAIATIGVIK